MSQKHKLLAQSVSETKEKLDTLKEAESQAQQQFKEGKISQEQYDALKREIIATEEQLKSLEEQAKNSNVVMQQISLAGEKMQEFGGEIESTGNKMLPATAAIAGLGAVAVKTTADFDEGMSKVAAISGTTGDEFDQLRAKAREMGAKTKFSASEAADAFQYMAMAGWKAEDMMDGIEGIMNLAAASGEDLATTSDIVTDALTAFGLTAAESGHFADIMAAASSNANTNVSMMGETFKYVAPVAGALGFSAEDTSVAIGLMANSGIKASQAGTSLRQILTNLGSGVELTGSAFAEAGESMGEYHVETVNADGTMRSLNDILVDLREGFSGLTDAEKAANAESIAGKVGMSGLLAIVNASQGDFDKLTQSVATCDGTSQRMAETMQDNLNGQMTILKSQLEELAISFGDLLMPIIREIVSHIQGLVDWLNGLSEEQKKIIAIIAIVIAAIGPLLIIIGKVVSGIGTLMTLVGGLSLPILGIVAAIVALIAIFVVLYNQNEEFRAKVNEIWGQVKDFIANVIAIIKQIITAFVELIKAIWNQFGNDIMNVVSAAFGFIQSFINTALTFIRDIITVVMALINGDWAAAWEAIKTLLYNLITNIVLLVQSWLLYVQNLLKLGLSIIKSIFDGLKAATIAIVTALKEKVIQLFTNIKDKVLETIEKLKEKIKEKITLVKETVIDGINEAVEWIKGLGEQAKTWGADLIRGFVDGIKSMLSSVADAAREVAEKVASFLHFSRPDVGPLHYYEEWMPDMMKGMAAGIRTNMWRIKDQLNSLTADMALTLGMDGAVNMQPTFINHNVVNVGNSRLVDEVNEQLGKRL